MSAWDEYVNQVMHKYDFDTNAVLTENMCTAVAIYGHDGAAWAFTADFPELLTYDFTVEGMCEADNVTVNVNEVDVANKAGQGERAPAGAAGIRLGNKKYMFVAHNPDSKVTMLSCTGGGAAIANINGASIIAFYDKNKCDSAGKNQSPGNVAAQVETMHAFLSGEGY
jgi:hypothetical protein